MSAIDPRAALVDLVEAALHVTRKLESQGLEEQRVTPLTPNERLVIQYIERNPGTSLQRLADELGFQKSNASSAVRRLSDLGLVDRTRDDADARRIALVITEAARKHIAVIHDAWSHALAGVELDPSDVEAAFRVVSRLDEWLTEGDHRTHTR